MKTVVEYAQKAHLGNPTDIKIKDFYEAVKLELNGSNPQAEEEKQKKNSDEPLIVEEQKSYAYTPAF